MTWIGCLFILIILYDWFRQRNRGVSLKDRGIVLAVSVFFFLLAGTLYYFKNKWNIPILFEAAAQTVQSWMFGRF